MKGEIILSNKVKNKENDEAEKEKENDEFEYSSKSEDTADTEETIAANGEESDGDFETYTINAVAVKIETVNLLIFLLFLHYLTETHLKLGPSNVPIS